jgi:hypothetical protein
MPNQPQQRGQGQRPPARPRDPVLNTRIIWAALLAGQVLFAVVAATLVGQGQDRQADPKLESLLSYVALGFLACGALIGYLVRAKIFAAGRSNDGISPRAYVSGTVILLAMLEGPSLLGIVAGMLGGSLWPAALAPLASIAIQIVNFPTGSGVNRS